MPIPILMPALSPTMEDGTLLKWMVKEGDSVAPGDVLAEIETDKATMEIEAVDEGIVGKILIGEGTEHVAVNKPIAVLLEEGEGADALAGFDGSAPESPSPQPSPPSGEGAEPEFQPSPPSGEGVEPESQPSPPDGEEVEPGSAEALKANGQAGRIFASPLARRLASDANLDLGTLPA